MLHDCNIKPKAQAKAKVDIIDIAENGGEFFTHVLFLCIVLKPSRVRIF
jgi:hypothetical protein